MTGIFGAIAGDHADVPYQFSRWVYSNGLRLRIPLQPEGNNG